MREKRNTVRRIGGLAAMLVSWVGYGAAQAQDFCSDLRALLTAAPSEFVSMIGAPVAGPWPSEISVFSGTQPLAGASGCVVAQQTNNGRRFSTSYTCSNAATDDATGMTELRQRIESCVDVSDWTEQSDNGALSSGYGLLRLSVTRNGERGGLALGIEIFRNERGEVLGSPTRGDVVDGNGVHRCSAKSPQQIADLFEMYGQREGAEPFESDQFRGVTNRLTQPMVAFVTRPTHPAHPAIITRGFGRRDGAMYVTASGDFAGDCQAFLELLDEVRRMNENLRPQR